MAAGDGRSTRRRVSFEVRTFSLRDNVAVVELWQQAFRDDRAWNQPEAIIERKQRVQPDLFVVAAVDGRVVGAAMGGYDGHRGWIYHVAVDGSQRRLGIGSALVRELERRLLSLGCPKVKLQVQRGDESAVLFYRALGYRTDEVVSLGKELVRPRAAS